VKASVERFIGGLDTKKIAVCSCVSQTLIGVFILLSDTQGDPEALRQAW
jgi:hypothetical protein